MITTFTKPTTSVQPRKKIRSTSQTMERNKYRVLDNKIRKVESKLIPILSTPLNLETTPSQQPVVETFHHNLHFMNNLLSAEMASSTEPQHLAHFVNRIIRLQRAVHSWTEGRPLTPQVESSGSDPGSLIESCVTDDDFGCDYNEEVSGLAGFTVYENPLFDGIVDTDDGYDDDADNDDDSDDDADDDNDNDYDVGISHDKDEVEEAEASEDDLIRVIDQGEEHETDAGTEGVEKEVIRVDYQKEEGKEHEEEEEEEDDEDEDEDGEEDTQNCCYKILFCSLIIVMVVIFMLNLSDFPDNHAPVMLTPT